MLIDFVDRGEYEVVLLCFSEFYFNGMVGLDFFISSEVVGFILLWEVNGVFEVF